MIMEHVEFVKVDRNQPRHNVKPKSSYNVNLESSYNVNQESSYKGDKNRFFHIGPSNIFFTVFFI